MSRMAVTARLAATSHRTRAWLLGVVSLATLSCGPKLVEDEKFTNGHYVRRRSASEVQGALLAEACVVVRSGFPSPAVAFDSTSLAKLKAKPGATLVYQDDLGLDYVEASRVGQPLPETDEFWCGIPETGGPGIGGLECLAVVDKQPSVTLGKVELLHAYTQPDFPNVTIASGFRATLTVLAPGKVTLGVPDTCPNGFPFSFAALEIEP